MVVAALGNAQVGIPGGRGENTGSALWGGVDVPQMAGPEPLFHHLVNGLYNVIIAAGAQRAIHLRQLSEHIFPVPLGHAAGHQNLLHLAGPFQLRCRQNGLDGLLTGGGQKAAGVDHHHIGTLLLHLDGVARGLDRGHHLLAVDPVFRAAQ